MDRVRRDILSGILKWLKLIDNGGTMTEEDRAKFWRWHCEKYGDAATELVRGSIRSETLYVTSFSNAGGWSKSGSTKAAG